MSVRLTLLALSTLLLSACDGNPLQTLARQNACCCDHCPTTAAPAAAKPAPTVQAHAPRERTTGGRVYRVRTEPVRVGEGGSYGSSQASEGYSGYGGRYGARSGGGVSVTVQDTATASSRYSYSESSSGYAYSSSDGGYAYGSGGVAGGGYGYPPGAMVSSNPPQYNRYRSASTTPGGWLEWPGKVED